MAKHKATVVSHADGHRARNAGEVLVLQAYRKMTTRSQGSFLQMARDIARNDAVGFPPEAEAQEAWRDRRARAATEEEPELGTEMVSQLACAACATAILLSRMALREPRLCHDCRDAEAAGWLVYVQDNEQEGAHWAWIA